MKIIDQIQDKAISLFFVGKLTLEEAHASKTKIYSLLDRDDFERVIIDFEMVTNIDSSGIGLIVSIFKEMREKKKGFALSGLNPRNRQLFKITKLDQYFDIYDEHSEALAAGSD